MSEQKYVATLVRGTIYLLAGGRISSDIIFHKDVGMVVAYEQKEHLEATAIDEVRGEIDPDTGSFEVFAKAKFHYMPYDGDLKPGERAEAVVKPAPRNVQPAPLNKKKRAAR